MFGAHGLMGLNEMKNMRKMPKIFASQRGVGLIEILVAVLVLGIGVLGVVAMQALTLKNTGSSSSRTQAAIQIYSMMDIIRADRANIGSYNTNVYVSGDGSGTVGTMAGWLDTLKTTVGPDAEGLVSCDANTMICTVGVQWDDSRAVHSNGDLSDHQTIQIMSQL